MALVAANLSKELFPLFDTPPDNIPDCATAWADAMQVYVASIVPPSVNVATASTVLRSFLILAFTANTAEAIEGAFEAYAKLIASGMAGYTSTPPPGLIGIATMANQPGAGVAALSFAIDVDTWMKTGTAAQISPPLPPVPWS